MRRNAFFPLFLSRGDTFLIGKKFAGRHIFGLNPIPHLGIVAN